ncbi:uncharacterized protein LOC107480712 [Arachis duranensis]|uniref:Uncharacterized protein LOC107480712 n=1 Tax=Arachis duranensis TaxID=130453 RepID=A0A9C6THY0_ARADU|nr:uncharacterized protein LOC107480712 [Arachis duranensis]
MPNRQKRPRAETRCGCPARMLLSMDDESGRWHVAFFSDAHNHHVLELRFSSMLPGHRKMSEADIEQMNDMRKGGIGVSRIHNFMASLASGYHNAPYTTRNMHNVNAKQRMEGGLDAESCLRYLQECKANDPALYYKEVVDVFSGVNHHNQTVVFATALVTDEKEETYVWLLQQLQTSMKGKAPVSIITDGDKQMKSAIEQRKWFEMVEKFGVADKRWVQDMYEKRHSWATAHIRGKFFAGFRTTSRCEGLHAMISRACAMRVVDSEDNGSYFIHTVSRYGTPGKEWRVVATSDTREVRCTCMRMECFGVPYEHIIAVLILNNVHEIPRSLILPRWTKDAKLVVMQSMGVIWDSVQLTQHWCLMDWYRKVCKITCHSIEKFQFARDIAVLMLKHFENEDAGNTSFPHEGPPTEGGRPPARNPPKRNTKGNGAHGGKKTQRCRLCREVGHNRTTCPERRTMEPSSAVAEDMDSMDNDMVYDNLSGDLYATAEIPSFQCSDSDTQAGFANSNFAGTNTSGPVMSLAD